MNRVAALFALCLTVLAGCSSPCDELVEKLCACGTDACQSVRHELKFETELFRTLGREGKRTLAERCRTRLPQVACPK